MQQSRRSFLRHFGMLGGCFVVTASPVAIGVVSQPRGGRGRYLFPQGVASADPQPDAVMFWTRAQHSTESETNIALRLQVARDAEFRDSITETEVTASAAHDFTVRVFLNGLEPDSAYFYRFLAPDSTPSRVGRTRTAPPPDARRPLTVAVFACQHYSDGFFSAYRQMLLDNEAAPADRKIDLVLHLGDFIYEFPEVDLYNPDGTLVKATNPDGTQRIVPPLPSGGPGSESRIAVTLEDFRHLYRTYLLDRDLQAARAAFPFVHIWDDHELVNDYWQSFVLTNSITRRKVDANQAWFEYVPAALTNAPKGPGGFSPARDFKQVAVDDVAPTSVDTLDDHYLVREANNLAAIRSLTAYRSLRWGSLVDLFLPDERSYRGPRGVVSSLLKGSLAPYPLAPVKPETVYTLNAGRTANGGRPPETVVHQGRAVENTRKDSPVGSIFGAEQKAWLKASLKKSDAIWRVLCNSVPMLRFGFDVTFRPGEPHNGLLWTDSWDGYPVERRELMEFLKQEGLADVVSIAGDRHAHLAGLIYDDYDGEAPKAVIPEFGCASTSAGCRAKVHGLEIQHDEDLKPLFLSIKNGAGGVKEATPTLNAWMLFGAEAARKLHETGDAAAARKLAKHHVNPHFRYSDMDAYGYLSAHFGPDRMEVQFVTIPEPLEDPGEAGPTVKRRVRYVVERWKAGEEPKISGLEIDGDPPLLGIKKAT